MGRLALILIVMCAALPSCKKKRTYDQSSAEATLTSFFLAVEHKRIPEQLDTFIANEEELNLWKFRCREKRCRTGAFSIRKVDERTGYSAVFLVDFEIKAKDGGSTMRGHASPIELEKRGKSWFIKSVGRKLGPKASSDSPKDGGATDTEE